MNQMNKLPYGKHFIDQDDIDAVIKVLKSDNLTQGPLIKKYEDKFASYVNAKYAIAVSSCSAGLHLSSLALGLNKNSNFITSPITFVSTASAGLHCGANLEFCDINPSTINLSIDKLEDILKVKKIDLVIPVHIAGLPCDMDSLLNLKKKYGFKIIEDAAHALGSKYECGNNIGSGAYSDVCVFSTHPVKTIATGEGGMITTNDYDIYKHILRLRSHGINKDDDQFLLPNNAFTDGERNLWYYEMRELGYHYRITDIQAALGISQLNKIDKFIQRRKEIVSYYRANIINYDNLQIVQKENLNSSNHLFVVNFNLNKIKKSKNQIMLEYRDSNIITQVHYIPLPLHPYFIEKNYTTDNIKNSLAYFESALSLPCYYALSNNEIDFIIDKTNLIINKN